ncbi:MAG TPA: serine hydrolase [Steroidobacteraceae bacterium]|nr:serine hydrolase [Steroidobacteraceae bacterium]
MLLLGSAATTQVAARDELPTASPETVGIDGPAITKLVADIRAGKYSNVHSLLVVRSGKLVTEEYFQGEDERRGQPLGMVRFDAATLHDLRSVSKSVTSALFGIAMAAGAISDLDTPVLRYFPEYQDLQTPERLRIRLRDVLSMTSGLEWDEDSRAYGDPLNSETAMDAASDRYRFVLSRPIAAAPGEHFRYSGGDTMLVAAVIERATKQRLNKYAEQVLFGPLGIERYEWITYPDGTPIAASGLRLLPRDMAKFGSLYMQSGQWQGKQVVPATWVKASTSVQAKISDRPFGFQNYGYQWWLGTARDAAHTPWIMAVGYGGQRIMLIPSHDLVLVMTSGMYRSRAQTDITFEVLLDGVLPAVK